MARGRNKYLGLHDFILWLVHGVIHGDPRLQWAVKFNNIWNCIKLCNTSEKYENKSIYMCCNKTPPISKSRKPGARSRLSWFHLTQHSLAHLVMFYILGFAYDCKLPPRNAKKLNRTCAAPWSPVVSQHWQLTLLVFVQFWWSWRQNVSTRAGKSIGDTFNVPGSKDTWSRD